MKKVKIKEFKLIGIKLNKKTTNANGQSGIDCGNMWQKFSTESIVEKIPGKLSNEIYAVYYEYEGDHTQPYSYFIGCKVASSTIPPVGLDSITIGTEEYTQLIAKGKMPDCIAHIWQQIWASDMKRKYSYDFEIYGERSQDWDNAEVEVFLS